MGKAFEIIFKGEISCRELQDLGYEDSLEETSIVIRQNCRVMELVLERWMSKHDIGSVDQLVALFQEKY